MAQWTLFFRLQTEHRIRSANVRLGDGLNLFTLAIAIRIVRNGFLFHHPPRPIRVLFEYACDDRNAHRTPARMQSVANGRVIQRGPAGFSLHGIARRMIPKNRQEGRITGWIRLLTCLPPPARTPDAIRFLAHRVPQFPFPAADRIRMDVIELTDVLDTMPASARGLSSGKESFLLLGKPLKKIPSVLSEQIHHCQEVVCRAQSPPRYIHFTHDNAEYGVSEIVARDSWVACAILPDASTSPTITLSMMSRRSWHTTVGSRAIPQCIHFTHDNAEYDVSKIVARDSCGLATMGHVKKVDISRAHVAELAIISRQFFSQEIIGISVVKFHTLFSSRPHSFSHGKS